MAMAHLVELGHTRIGILAGQAEDPVNFDVPGDRIAGARLALGHEIDGDLIAPGQFTVEGGRRAAATLLAMRPLPTAIFALSDEMAFGALIAARELAITIPGDVSLVGVDDHEIAQVMGLTTVRQHVVDHGARAADMLLRRLAGATPARPASRPRGAAPRARRAQLDPSSRPVLDLADRTCKRLHPSGASRPVAHPATAKGGTMRRTWIRLAVVPVALAMLAAACSTSDDDDSSATQRRRHQRPRRPRRQPSRIRDDRQWRHRGDRGTERGAHDGAGRRPRRVRRDDDAAAHAGSRQRRVGDRLRRRGLGERGRRRAGRPERVRQGQRHRRSPTSAVATSSSRSTAQVLGGNPPDIGVFPQPGKLAQFATDGDLLKVPDDVVAAVDENWDDELHGVLQRRRHAVRRAAQVRPQVARLVRPERVGREGLQGADDADRVQGARWTR